jgi:hypothetical protein
LAFSIVKADDSGYVICGYTSNNDSDWKDIYIIKIDSGGNKQWDKTFVNIYDDMGYSIYKTNDNVKTFTTLFQVRK